MQENYLAKWLNNELSDEELAAFKQTEEYASYEKIARTSEALSPPSFDMDRALADLRERKGSEVRVVRMRPRRYLMQIAAAITVLIAASVFYISTLDETFSAAYAQRTEVVLPDASEVILNAGSELSFSERNWEKERKLTLEGEAFFKVAKGEKFTVRTDVGSVSVLGTQFNVKSRNGYFEVTCYEGLVSVDHKGRQMKLPAGSSFLVINGEVKDVQAPMTTEPTWVNDESSFRSIPLSFVLKEFERQFNVRVETQNVDLSELFTGSFSNTNMNLALQSISTPSQISFTLEGNKVLFYGDKTP
ncbi:FecR family protein [Muriicola jejuensis]|uniref:Histidine kinase n=1 Tax=Muriicola jejuensis TaxID=504488 RepID=A0A6P0UDJ6_9FLAO|nr:FecR domain-containing protein [Muriicola jejuensis]NER10550.1 histidine kinase [Muriicola jejuensis]SMP18169.1 FecR family protein [Muriicola jejuensis]